MHILWWLLNAADLRVKKKTQIKKGKKKIYVCMLLGEGKNHLERDRNQDNNWLINDHGDS